MANQQFLFFSAQVFVIEMLKLLGRERAWLWRPQKEQEEKEIKGRQVWMTEPIMKVPEHPSMLDFTITPKLGKQRTL